MRADACAQPVCGVVGLGFVGTCTARLLLRAGLPLRGFDLSSSAVARAEAELGTLFGRSGDCELGTDPDLLAAAKVVVVAVRLQRDRDGNFRDDALERVAETLNAHCLACELVVIESTLEPGTTRRFAERWLHLSNVEVAHVPERLRIGDPDAAVLQVPRLVGGLSEQATERACAFLRRAGIEPVPVSAPEVSELAKLLENAFLTTSIGLIGEITRLAHGLGVAAREVTEAAATKPHGYMGFHPGPGIGGHCLRNDLDLLRTLARHQAVQTPLLDGVAETVSALPALVVARLEQRLGDLGLSLVGASVLLVGVGFKIGSPDLTETPATPITRALREAGATVAYLDAKVPVFAVDGLPLPRVHLEELVRLNATAVLILSGDQTLAIESLRRGCLCLLDAGGGASMEGELANVERL
jgi:UDP-N-acetyl-D-glucosamine dehydrogenase